MGQHGRTVGVLAVAVISSLAVYAGGLLVVVVPEKPCPEAPTPLLQQATAAAGASSNAETPAPPAAPADEEPAAASITAVEVAVGSHHACARMRDKTVWCWGDNDTAQLGPAPGHPGSALARNATPVAGLSGVTGIVAAGSRTCAIVSRKGEEQVVYCWGDGRSPQRIGALETVTAIAIASETTCALRKGGQVFCWPHRQVPARPAPRAELSQVSAIAAAWGELCVVTNEAAQNSRVSCFGSTLPEKGGLTLEALPELAGASQVSVGPHFRCGLMPGGAVTCAGWNLRAAFGPNEDAKLSTVIRGGATALVTRGETSCAIVSGRLLCWGDNSDSQAGNGEAQLKTPTAVAGLKAVMSFAVGDASSCAIDLDGTVSCWGANGHGELGNGRFGRYHNRPHPVRWDRPTLEPTAHHACFDDGATRNWTRPVTLDKDGHTLVFCSGHSHFEYMEPEFQANPRAERCARIDLKSDRYEQLHPLTVQSSETAKEAAAKARSSAKAKKSPQTKPHKDGSVRICGLAGGRCQTLAAPAPRADDETPPTHYQSSQLSDDSKVALVLRENGDENTAPSQLVATLYALDSGAVLGRITPETGSSPMRVSTQFVDDAVMTETCFGGCGEDCKVSLWSARTGAHLLDLPWTRERGVAAERVEANVWAFLTAEDLQLVDVAAGTVLERFATEATSKTLLPSGELLLLAPDGTAEIVDLKRRAIVRTLKAPTCN